MPPLGLETAIEPLDLIRGWIHVSAWTDPPTRLDSHNHPGCLLIDRSRRDMKSGRKGVSETRLFQLNRGEGYSLYYFLV